MGKWARVSAVLAGCGAVLALAGCAKLKSRDQQNQGVHDFESARFSDAVEHFKQAVDLDPTNPTARLYLATSYLQQWIPGAESPQNLEFAARAREEFTKVLEQNPKDLTALESLASIAYNEAQALPPDKRAAKYAETTDWNHKLLEVDPKNKQAYYFLGVIAYQKWHPQLALAQLALKMRQEDPGPLKDKKVKDQLKAEYAASLDEGIANLQKAVDIDKDYADAMTYEELLIREKAFLSDDRAAYDAQVKAADDIFQQIMPARKRAEAAKAANTPGGIVTDAK